VLLLAVVVHSLSLNEIKASQPFHSVTSLGCWCEEFHFSHSALMLFPLFFLFSSRCWKQYPPIGKFVGIQQSEPLGPQFETPAVESVKWNHHAQRRERHGGEMEKKGNIDGRESSCSNPPRATWAISLTPTPTTVKFKFASNRGPKDKKASQQSWRESPTNNSNHNYARRLKIDAPRFKTLPCHAFQLYREKYWVKKESDPDVVCTCGGVLHLLDSALCDALVVFIQTRSRVQSNWTSGGYPDSTTGVLLILLQSNNLLFHEQKIPICIS